MSTLIVLIALQPIAAGGGGEGGEEAGRPNPTTVGGRHASRPLIVGVRRGGFHSWRTGLLLFAIAVDKKLDDGVSGAGPAGDKVDRNRAGAL